jgi:DnaJ-class molecular chaperone
LGIQKGATDDELKRAYKKLALKFHPDKNRAPQATDAFKKIATAFACLSDPQKRRIYDEHGTEDDFRQRYHQ